MATRTKLGSGVIRVECDSRDEQAKEVSRLVKMGGKATTYPPIFTSKRAAAVAVRMPRTKAGKLGQLYSVEDWTS